MERKELIDIRYVATTAIYRNAIEMILPVHLDDTVISMNMPVWFAKSDIRRGVGHNVITTSLAGLRINFNDFAQSVDPYLGFLPVLGYKDDVH